MSLLVGNELRTGRNEAPVARADGDSSTELVAKSVAYVDAVIDLVDRVEAEAITEVVCERVVAALPVEVTDVEAQNDVVRDADSDFDCVGEPEFVVDTLGERDVLAESETVALADVERDEDGDTLPDRLTLTLGVPVAVMLGVKEARLLGKLVFDALVERVLSIVGFGVGCADGDIASEGTEEPDSDEVGVGLEGTALGDVFGVTERVPVRSPEGV